MMVPIYRILVIDDNLTDAGLVERHLRRVTAFTAEVAKAPGHLDGLRQLAEHGADCVILDYKLGPESGLGTLRAIRERGDDTAVVFVTGLGNEMVAVEALLCGAQDYLVKSVLAPEVLQRAILNAVEKVTLGRRLGEKQRELEEFVSVVAHDLQQPLCAVKGNVELIRDFYAANLDAKALEFVEAAVRTSSRMAEMIDALLDYARAGRNRAPIEHMELDEVLAGVCGDLGELIARSDAQVTVQPLPIVSGDRVSLAQLFQNLIANAIKFRGQADPEITIGGARHRDAATLWVRDNGMGIPAGSLETIFAPFQRLAQSKALPGSGIGLATCKKIAEQHRGRIWVESESGGGSTFFVLLPCSPRRAKAETSAHCARVLVVDSEPDGGRALAGFLEDRGMSALPAYAVQEASEVMKQERFAALVVDMALPEGHGLELIRLARELSPDMAVLAVAAGNDRSAPGPLLAEARRHGADHVLPKPLDGAQVATVLRRMIAASGATSPAA